MVWSLIWSGTERILSLMQPMITDKVKDLIAKAQIVSFATWTSTHPAKAIAIFQAADRARVDLTDEECDRI